MVILKKVRAASLLETLVATTIVVTVFMVASLILENLILSSIKGNSRHLNNRIDEVAYFLKFNKYKQGFYEEKEFWQIQAYERESDIYLKVLNKRNNTTIDTLIINGK